MRTVSSLAAHYRVLIQRALVGFSYSTLPTDLRGFLFKYSRLCVLVLHLCVLGRLHMCSKIFFECVFLLHRFLYMWFICEPENYWSGKASINR